MRTKTQVENFGGGAKRLKALSFRSSKTKDWDRVDQGRILAIRDLYPGPASKKRSNVYDALAEAYIAKGDKARAMEQLEAYSKTGGRDPKATLKLGLRIVRGGSGQKSGCRRRRSIGCMYSIS